MNDVINREERLKFLNINATTSQALRSFRPILEKNIDELLEAFYAHAMGTDATRSVFQGKSVDHAKAMQRRHWLDNVFSGEFNDSYFAQSVRIGQIHEKVGLEPRWYMAGYCFAISRMVAIAASQFHKKPQLLSDMVEAINKAAFLDMDLGVSVYIAACKETAAKLIGAHADAFERDVGSLVSIVASAATELQSSASSMTKTAETTSQQSSSVSSAADRASTNVQTVASATEELTASIQ